MKTIQYAMEFNFDNCKNVNSSFKMFSISKVISKHTREIWSITLMGSEALYPCRFKIFIESIKCLVCTQHDNNVQCLLQSYKFVLESQIIYSVQQVSIISPVK